MSSQNVGPGAGWGEMANGMAREAGELVLGCDRVGSHESIFSNRPMNSSGPKL